jgi:outer membrane protein
MLKLKASVLTVLIFGTLLTQAAPQAFAADDVLKVGTVDMQHALQSVEAGKKAKSQLEKEFNAKKKDLQSEEASIKKMGEEFKKQAAVMNEDARAKKQAEIQERIMKFQEVTARSQADIQQKERDLTQPIIVKLRGVISDLAKSKGYTVVLEKNENTVLYSLEKDDLTQDVIGAYNKQVKSSADASSSIKKPNHG